jgi:hypothetical protein
MPADDLYKIGRVAGDGWARLDRGDVFGEDAGGDGRLLIASRRTRAHPLQLLAAHLKGPFGILYVLHTPRGDAKPGRYESPLLSRAELDAFLAEHHDFFSRDSRHDIWLHDTDSGGMLVWDRHDIIHAYGPLEDFKRALRKSGYEPGKVEIPDPHQHHYHAAFDGAQAKVLKAFEWHATPLKPEDEQ